VLLVVPGEARPEDTYQLDVMRTRRWYPARFSGWNFDHLPPADLRLRFYWWKPRLAVAPTDGNDQQSEFVPDF
jgi:hypothetical protein